MFRAVLVTPPKRMQTNNSLNDEHVLKILSLHVIKYYSSMNRNEVLVTHAPKDI